MGLAPAGAQQNLVGPRAATLDSQGTELASEYHEGGACLPTSILALCQATVALWPLSSF